MALETDARNFDELLKSIKEDYERFGGEEDIKQRCRHYFESQIFVSHTSKDHGFCKSHIIPVLEQFGLYGYFFISRAMNPAIASAYRFMVEHTLACCKTIIIALSEKSAVSEWVQLEASWAVSQSHPIIICRLDRTEPDALHPAFASQRRWPWSSPPLRMIDFDQDINVAQKKLDRLLHTSTFAPGINRFA
jgi:hypothetical protein